ncbi:MAG: hypothetical protein UW66_C0027G0001, partial [Candidatus Moranbacteria bacterium GW2011_GWF1_44_4]
GLSVKTEGEQDKLFEMHFGLLEVKCI